MIKCPYCNEPNKESNRFCAHCGKQINLPDNNVSCDSNISKIGQTVANNVNWKKISLVVLPLIILFILITAIRGYKLEMNYTENNVKRFVNAIEKYGSNFSVMDNDITINKIEVDDDGKSANVSIYAKHSFYKATDLRLSFEYGHAGWDENGYALTIREYGSDGPASITICGVAEGVEKMLTGKSLVEDYYYKYYGTDQDCVYKLGKYFVRCSFSTFGMTPSFRYLITTHHIPG